MGYFNFHQNELITTCYYAMLAVIVVICLVIFPEQAFHASHYAFMIWWQIIFPTLLPFFAIFEMTKAFGWSKGIGLFIDPLLYRWLRLPRGSGECVLLGWLVGYPHGICAISEIHKNNGYTSADLQRLTSLSYMTNPMIIIGIIGVGIYQQVQLGVFLLMIQWFSALLTALIIRCYTRNTDDNIHTSVKHNHLSFREKIKTALNEMHRARLEDGRNFGKILGDAVTNTIQHLWCLGGLMMMMSVIHQLIYHQLSSINYPKWCVGILDVHLGVFSVANSSLTPNFIHVTMISIILAWGGLSTHLDIQRHLQLHQVKYMPFCYTRLIHMCFALICTCFLWYVVHPYLNSQVISTIFLNHMPTEDENIFLSKFNFPLPTKDFIQPLLSSSGMLFAGIVISIISTVRSRISTRKN